MSSRIERVLSWLDGEADDLIDEILSGLRRVERERDVVRRQVLLRDWRAGLFDTLHKLGVSEIASTHVFRELMKAGRVADELAMNPHKDAEGKIAEIKGLLSGARALIGEDEAFWGALLMVEELVKKRFGALEMMSRGRFWGDQERAFARLMLQALQCLVITISPGEDTCNRMDDLAKRIEWYKKLAKAGSSFFLDEEEVDQIKKWLVFADNAVQRVMKDRSARGARLLLKIAKKLDMALDAVAEDLG